MIPIRTGAGREGYFAAFFRDKGKVKFSRDQLRHRVNHSLKSVFLPCGAVEIRNAIIKLPQPTRRQVVVPILHPLS